MSSLPSEQNSETLSRFGALTTTTCPYARYPQKEGEVKRAVTAVIAAFIGALLAFAPSAAAAATPVSAAIFVGGSATPAEPLSQEVMQPFIAPFFAPNSNAQNPFISEWKYANGTPADLRLFIQETQAGVSNGPVGIIAISAGTDSVHAVQLQMDQENPVLPASSISFVYIGDTQSPDGLRARLGMDVSDHGDSAFETTYLYGEYDLWADFPDRGWNLVAVANSVLALPYGHMEMGTGSINDPLTPENLANAEIEERDGYTVVRVPTRQLPLTRPLRDVGHFIAQTEQQHALVDNAIDAIDKPLRQIVDAGYSHNDNKPGSLVNQVKSAVSPSNSDDDSVSEARAVKPDDKSSDNDKPRRKPGNIVRKVADNIRNTVSERRAERQAERESRKADREDDKSNENGSDNE